MNEHLQATLGLDNTPFQRGLRGAKAMAKDFTEFLSGTGIAGKISAFLVPLFALSKLKEAAAAAIEFASSIGDAADQLDVSTDFLQAWNKQVSLSGGSSEDASKGLETLARKLGDVSNGTAGANDAFEKYGINVRDASGTLKNTEEVVYDIAEAMKQAKNQSEANAIAFDLLGKSGMHLVNSLAGGKDGLKETIGLLKSAVPTEEEIRAVKELGDTLTDIKNTILGINVKILSTLFGGSIGDMPKSQAVDLIQQLRDMGAKFQGDPAIKLTKEQEKALKKLQDAKRKFEIEDANGMERVKLLREDEAQLIAQKIAAGGDVAKQSEIELEILNKQQAIKKTLIELDKARFDQMEKAAKKDSENQALLTKFNDAKANRLKFATLQELAAVPEKGVTSKTLLFDIIRARQALDFRGKGDEALKSGNVQLAKRFFDAADANVAKISSLKQQEDIAQMLKELLRLNAKVENGIIVIPKNGP